MAGLLQTLLIHQFTTNGNESSFSGLEDEDLQIYKTPKTDKYELHRHRWEFFGKRDFRKTMILALDGDAWMSGQQKFELMKTLLSEKDQRKMEKMLQMGFSHDDVVSHFMEEAEKKSGNSDLRRKMEAAMLQQKDLSEEELMEVMRNQLGNESIEEMERLVKEGHSVQDVMQKMMQVGRTKEEEVIESAETVQHLIKTKKKNIKLSDREAEDMLNERLDEMAKVKLKKLMDSGISMKDALSQVLKEAKPEESLTEMEKKILSLTHGQELSQYEMYNLIKDQLDEESAAKMEEMVRSGCPLDEAIEYFMKKGKTREQVKNEKSEKLRNLVEQGGMDMSPTDILNLMKEELGSEDKKQIEKMLKSGCSMQEVIDHFLNRGAADADSMCDGKTEFQIKMEALIEGKNLNDEEILAMMRGQMDDKAKDEIKEMLAKGYSPRDIINYMLKNTKTEEEKLRETSQRLSRLFEDSDMTEEEKMSMLEKQLSVEDKMHMEEMLKQGHSIEEVIGFFMSRSKSPENEKSEFAKNIDKLVREKDMSQDEILKLIENHLDKESREKLSEMLAKGYSKQDVINHFMNNSKTKEEQMKETAEKIKALMSDDSMTDKDKIEILRNQLSKEDLAQLEILLKDGGSVDDVMKQILKSKSTESISETELSKVVHQLMDGQELSKEEIIGLIKGHIDGNAKIKLEDMIAKGLPLQDVIDHFLTSGKTVKEAHRDVSWRVQALIANISHSPRETIEIIKSVLDGVDLAQMEVMLRKGCTPEEVIALFAQRALQEESSTELAARVKKLSGGKPLCAEQLLELIKSQLGTAGNDEMISMFDRGYSVHDVVAHFLEKGKTLEEEQCCLRNLISKLINSSMSEKEIMELMKDQLTNSDKKIMENMLKQGKSMQDVLNHFSEKVKLQSFPNNELMQKIKKLSSGRKLSSEEMLDLIRENISGEDKEKMESMMKAGFSATDIVKHFLGNLSENIDQEHRELSTKLDQMIDVNVMTDTEILAVLNSHLSSTDKQEMDFMLQQGCSLEEIVAYFKSRGMDSQDGPSELSRRIKKISAGKQLPLEDLLQLIREQLGPIGHEKINEMLQKGVPLQEVIDYFMAHGKTEQEEHREVALKLSKLVQKRKLSREEIQNLLESELCVEDRAKMTSMMKHGCTIEEVLDFFLIRGSPPHECRTLLARKVRKISRGKDYTKKEIIEIIRQQLTQESQEKLDQMLVKGYNHDDVITHFMVKGKTCEEEFREIGQKLVKIIDKKTMSEEQIIQIMKEHLGIYDQAQIDEMIRRGCTTPEILDLFLNRGMYGGAKTELAKKIEKLTEGICLHPVDLLELIKENCDEDIIAEIESMLMKGYTVQDVIEHALKYGKLIEEKHREIAEKMKQLLNSNMKEEDVLTIMKKQMGHKGCALIEELLAKGYTLGEIVDKLLNMPADEQEEVTEFAKKIKQLMGEKVLNADELISLIRTQLDMSGQMQLDEMLRNGCTKDEVIQHFMTRERNKKGQRQNEFGRKIFDLTKGSKLTRREIILLMKTHLDEDSIIKMEDMIKKCYPMEDIIDYFLKNGKTPEQAALEKKLLKEQMKKETCKKIRKMISGHNLSNEEILAILKLQMGDDDRAQLENMFKRGCSTQEIIEHFMNRDISDDEAENTMFEKKIYEMIEGKNLSKDEILDLMRSELDDDSVQQLDLMLKKGYTKDDVIKYFMKHGDDRNDFVQEMKKLTDQENLTKEEILDVMKNKLGVLSQRKMEDMLREGFTIDEVIKHLLTHGKTQEQETSLFTRRMSLLLDEKPLTEQEKVEKLKENLGKEAASMLEELMKNGLTAGHVLDLFLKHGNNVNDLIKDSFFLKDIKFPDEPQDAENHANRNVFSVVDITVSKAEIPWMSPSGKNHIFGLFFEKVLEVIAGKSLTHREIMDLMRSRMGAGYAKEFDELRAKGLSLQEIVSYFLKRDAETIAESRLVAKLKADARVDSRVYLKRKYTREKWGVSLTYTFRYFLFSCAYIFCQYT